MPFTGLSRVEELENALQQVLDLYEQDFIVINESTSEDEQEVVADVMDAIGETLVSDGPYTSEEDD
jgi:hypothetical protein